MHTECTTKLFEFEAVDQRGLVAGFDGGDITSNAGGLLLGQVDRGLGLVRRFAQCFSDRRDPRYTEHRVETLVEQRILGLVLGYKDVNDHDELRKDPTLTALTGKLRRVLRSDCEALAGKSTLNRLEHTPKRHGAKYHKIDCDSAQVDALLVDFFLERMSARRARSCLISTIPTSRSTARRKAASSTAITTNTAICRSTCSAAGTCGWPGSGVPTSPTAMARSRR